MDPTANLNEQRAIAARVLAGRAEPGDLERLAELVDELDGWLLMGGALPDRWPARQPRAVTA